MKYKKSKQLQKANWYSTKLTLKSSIINGFILKFLKQDFSSNWERQKPGLNMFFLPSYTVLINSF